MVPRRNPPVEGRSPEVPLLTTAGRLLVCIAASPGITAAELGSTLGLSTRTVARGLNALRDAGRVRIAPQGRSQGYIAIGRPGVE